MRSWKIAAAAAVVGFAAMVGAPAAKADGWADSLNSKPFAAARAKTNPKTNPKTSAKPTVKPTRVASGTDVDRPQRKTASVNVVTSGSGTTGVASYYWQPQRVASGGWFNPNAMTAAHKTLPFGTRVRVTHLGNGKSVEVTINDRGPYIAGRIIDLSKAAAGQINMQGQGIAQVRMEVIGR